MSLRRKMSWLCLLIMVSFGLMLPSTVWADAPGVNSWKKATNVGSDLLWKVYSFDGQFFAGGDNGTIITSADGLNWDLQTGILDGRIRAFASGTPGYVVVSGNEDTAVGEIAFSSDGVTWVKQYSDNIKLNGAVWGDNKFVVVGDHGKILTSEDGVTWTESHSLNNIHFYSVIWANNKFVAVGGLAGSHDRIITSSDGMNWGAVIAGNRNGYLRGITWGKDQFVAVGGPGKVRTSPDGENWQYQDVTGFNKEIWSVTWANNQYLAVGSDGTVLTSVDGEEWAVRANLTADTLYGVVGVEGKYVAVGANASVFYGTYVVNDFKVSDDTDDGVTSRTVDFEWTPVDDADADVIIQLKKSSEDDDAWTDADTTGIVTEGGVSGTTVINLEPNEEYDFRIKINGEWYDGDTYEDLSNTVKVKTKVEYTVTFNKNGGDTEAVPLTKAATQGGTIDALPTAPTWAGYTFMGWNTAADGSGTVFDATTVVNSSFTVYAQWQNNTHTVTFNKNGGDTEAVPLTKAATQGGTIDALPTAPTRAGYIFMGWNTAADGSGTVFDATTVVNTSFTVYAQWESNSYTVTFDSNGGTNVPSINANHNTTIAKPANPIRAGYSFMGWYKEDTLITPWDFTADTVKMNITLYAKWSPIPSSPVVTQVEVEVEEPGFEIIVNGSRESQWASVQVTEEDGREIFKVHIDEVSFRQRLQEEENGFKVAIPIKTNSDISISQLDGELVRIMEEKDVILELRNNLASYTIPAEYINIHAISASFGSVQNLEDIKIDITIATPRSDRIQAAEQAAKQGGFVIVVPPLDFTVTASYDGKSMVVGQYPGYVERLITIPEGVDPKRITTAIVVEADGEVRHVPTEVIVSEGNYYARVNSLTDSTYATIWNEVEFDDVHEHWAKDTINNMGSRIVVYGTDESSYSPERYITRAEFAAILVRGLGLKPRAGVSVFSDIHATDWYNGAVNTAYEYQLINGFEDGTFRPMEEITREQAMKMIASAMKITGLQQKLQNQSASMILRAFDDADAISHWAKDGVADTVQAGIVKGRSNSELAPKHFIKRSEVVALIERLLKQSGLI